jgi:hypothetical protein
MARQEDACWGCGARWASEDVPQTRLRVIAGGQLARDAARAEARLDADRWVNEGGSVDFETAAVAWPAVAARR